MQAYNHLSQHDAYVCRLQHLCQKGLFSEIASLLSALPLSDAFFAGQEVVTWLIETLDDMHLESMSEDSGDALRALSLDDGENLAFALFSEAGACITELLLELGEKSLNSTGESTSRLIVYTINRNILRTFRVTACLAREFGVALSPKRLGTDVDSASVMSSYLRYLALKKEAHIWENSASAPHTSEEKRVSQQDTTLGAKSFRLAEALGISRAHLKSLAAIEAAAAGDAKQALFLGREIQEKPLDECVSSSLVQIAQQLSEQKLVWPDKQEVCQES